MLNSCLHLSYSRHKPTLRNCASLETSLVLHWGGVKRPRVICSVLWLRDRMTQWIFSALRRMGLNYTASFFFFFPPSLFFSLSRLYTAAEWKGVWAFNEARDKGVSLSLPGFKSKRVHLNRPSVRSYDQGHQCSSAEECSGLLFTWNHPLLLCLSC